ncbi:TPA: ATP-binding cassette domain-containing protein [Klebsiella aerogenes]|nr:ATP-binding cassette domain-containing protein [Klebsiella aerogenes]HEI8768256.1 ATP-binding cassette domain-containing protein [Klebsiella aerogenes]
MLTVHNLTLTLHRQPLLCGVNFSVAPGEVLTLMGPSGCGKSTLFAWMIGALADTFRAEGELWLNKRRCDGLATEARRIGILFQDALLFDHFSVGHNLQLALLARPQALLLDEPFNRLDAELRADFRQWVFAEIDRLAIPAVLVTHDSQDLPPGGRCINIAAWQANSA